MDFFCSLLNKICGILIPFNNVKHNGSQPNNLGRLNRVQNRYNRLKCAEAIREFCVVGSSRDLKWPYAEEKIMITWMIVTIVVVWMLLSATILLSLCIMSSRYNNQEEYQEESAKEPIHYPETNPAISVSSR